jgi:hypothetical protein
VEFDSDDDSAAQPLRYNFQHGVESWWLMLWFITTRVDHFETHKFAQDIFQNTSRPTFARQAFFLYLNANELGNCLHRSLRPFAPYILFAGALLHNLTFTAKKPAT